ncbi:MAG TPA: hypothetical protein VFW30_02845 [Bryocella sp.]|nr:hypothetical protein [Bryocella sp.]
MTTPKQMTTMLAAATLFAATAVCSAQIANPGPVNSTVQEQQAAPIERAYPNQNRYAGPPRISSVTIAPGQEVSPAAGQAQATPIEGVILRVGPQSTVQEVSSTPEKLELRVEHGLANVNVHKPAKDTLVLVDLPGGQTQILKDGLYTFNAETNTARVLKGEALAFPADAANEKPIKVKEYHKVVYSGADVRPHEFVPYEAAADLLPGRGYDRGREAEPGYGYGRGFGYGPYGDGFYPYYAYGYPGWGYPYGFYPYGYGFYPYGLGLGFTYFGGFHGGYGIHGGGFHGGGFRGGHGRR